MNIQLHQTIKLKPGYCKGKILTDDDARGICYLVQIIEGPTSKNFDYSVGSELIVLKNECWQYTQKIESRGTIVSEPRIVFSIKNIVGAVVECEKEKDDETDDRK